MKNKMIGFIGCGNMGKAMLGSLISSGEIRKENIIVSKNELIILSFLIKNVGKIVSREEIIKRFIEILEENIAGILKI